MRQWILLIPFVTALLGTGFVQLGPQEAIVDYLPAVFFIGALIVTATLLHHRQTAATNFQLAEQLHAANARLDILHRLEQDMNRSLDAAQVSETVLDYCTNLLPVDAAALWLRSDDVTRAAMGIEARRAKHNDSDELEAWHDRWQQMAARGFGESAPAGVLRQCENILERVDEGAREVQSLDEQNVAGWEDEVLFNGRVGESASVTAVPIIWHGQHIGVLFVANWQQSLSDEDVVLLKDIIIVAGAALQNALLYQSAMERAQNDGLTGLLNHRTVQERLAQEVARVQRTRPARPAALAVAVMDLADFKFFNDTYGHAVGDRVLRTVSESLRKSLRVNDIIGRFGGDEFIVVLPDTTCAEGERICLRAIQTISAVPFQVPGGAPMAIRLNCGVAAFPDNAANIAELLQLADDRLYEAKSQGKLMVESCGGAATEGPSMKPAWNSIGILESLIMAIDKKDRYTRRHTEKVWKYALLIAHELELSAHVLRGVHIAALVFDIGKIVVPDAILRKPGGLTADELRIMRQHPEFGAMIVNDVPHLDLVLQGVRHHHERFDGQGYPSHLSGHEIPLIGRLLAVADSFAAMTSERSYRKALSEEEGLLELERESGKQFDPEIVAALGRVLRKADKAVVALQKAMSEDAAFLANSVAALNVKSASDGATPNDSAPPQSEPETVHCQSCELLA